MLDLGVEQLPVLLLLETADGFCRATTSARNWCRARLRDGF